MDTPIVRVLLIEDDEGTFPRVRDLLAEVDGTTYDLSWAASWDDGLARLASDCVDLALVGARTGVELIDAAIRSGVDVPLILLTDNARTSGHDALDAGAADFVVRQDLTPAILVRSFRYAIGQAEATRARRASEARFRALFHHSSDMIIVADPSGAILHVNGAIETILGFRPEDVIGTPGADLIHPDDLPAALEALVAVSRQPRATIVARHRNRHADGGWRWVESTVTNLLDDPAVGGLVSASRDISARVDAEEQLRQ